MPGEREAAEKNFARPHAAMSDLADGPPQDNQKDRFPTLAPGSDPLFDLLLLILERKSSRKSLTPLLLRDFCPAISGQRSVLFVEEAYYIYLRMVSVAESGEPLMVTVTFTFRGELKASSQLRNSPISRSSELWATLHRLSIKIWEMS